MAAPANSAWRAIVTHGFADLSPPEAQHALLELPTNRANYVGVLQDLGDYPVRSPIGQRLPSDADVRALTRAGGVWRAVVALDDYAAAAQAACLFDRVFVLDPLYDSGNLLYAAWHDPFIRDEHARQLAEQAAGLVRLAPLLNEGVAILAPDHLPGSWNPRPAWRRPRAASADERQLAAWAMRSALVLLYWADRLDAVVCATAPDVRAAMHVALGLGASTRPVRLGQAPAFDDVRAWRQQHANALRERWATLRRLTRRRPRACLDPLAEVFDGDDPNWHLVLGESSLPQPAMLIRRVFNGQDPGRDPPLPRRRLRRRPLCLLGLTEAPGDP